MKRPLAIKRMMKEEDGLNRKVCCVETKEVHTLERWANVIAHARSVPKKFVVQTLRGRCNTEHPLWRKAYGHTWRWA